MYSATMTSLALVLSQAVPIEEHEQLSCRMEVHSRDVFYWDKVYVRITITNESPHDITLPWPPWRETGTLSIDATEGEEETLSCRLWPTGNALFGGRPIVLASGKRFVRYDEFQLPDNQSPRLTFWRPGAYYLRASVDLSRNVQLRSNAVTVLLQPRPTQEAEIVESWRKEWVRLREARQLSTAAGSLGDFGLEMAIPLENGGRELPSSFRLVQGSLGNIAKSRMALRQFTSSADVGTRVAIMEKTQKWIATLPAIEREAVAGVFVDLATQSKDRGMAAYGEELVEFIADESGLSQGRREDYRKRLLLRQQ